MSMKRIRFALSDTGTIGDTGYLDGEIEMMRWYPAHDTGASLIVTLLPSEGDTGHGFIIWNDTGHLREQYTVFPRNRANFGTGNELVTSDSGVPVKYVGAGDKLHVQATKKKAGSTIGGTLYIYYRQ